jgi:hypothetical protein
MTGSEAYPNSIVPMSAEGEMYTPSVAGGKIDHTISDTAFK